MASTPSVSSFWSFYRTKWLLSLINLSYTLNIKIPPLSYTLSLKKKPLSDGALASPYRPLKRVPFPRNQGRPEVGVAGPCAAKKALIWLLRLRELQGDAHTILYDVTNQSTFYFISLLFSKWSSHIFFQTATDCNYKDFRNINSSMSQTFTLFFVVITVMKFQVFSFHHYWENKWWIY